jgi:hypothetical protein
MKLKFDRQALWILDQMVRVPQAAEFQRDIFAVNPPHGMKQWAAKDMAAARQIRHVQSWLKEKVLEKKSEDILGYPESWVGELPKNYVQRILDIVKYYEPLGMLAGRTEAWLSLLDSLEGKTGEDEEAIEDLLNYKGGEDAEEQAEEKKA